MEIIAAKSFYSAKTIYLTPSERRYLNEKKTPLTPSNEIKKPVIKKASKPLPKIKPLKLKSTPKELFNKHSKRVLTVKLDSQNKINNEINIPIKNDSSGLSSETHKATKFFSRKPEERSTKTVLLRPNLKLNFHSPTISNKSPKNNSLPVLVKTLEHKENRLLTVKENSPKHFILKEKNDFKITEKGAPVALQTISRTIIEIQQLFDCISEEDNPKIHSDFFDDSFERIGNSMDIDTLNPLINSLGEFEGNKGEKASKAMVNELKVDEIEPPPQCYPIFNCNKSAKGNTKLKSEIEVSSLSVKPKGLRNKKIPKLDKDDKEQLIIDVGQRSLRPVQCNTCGMVYSQSEPTDVAAHSKFHEKFLSSLRFPGWKKERVLQEFEDGRILLILPSDPKYALNKVIEVQQVVDADLGFLDDCSPYQTNCKIYLFITSEKKVAGCCIAEEISEGFRVLPENEITISDGENERAWCCSNKPEKAVVGISRIWVFREKRRQKIATRLIDCIRAQFAYLYPIPISEVAFSDPTPDGKQFAIKYTQTPYFLVYKYANH